jgi:hypothetical protein
MQESHHQQEADNRNREAEDRPSLPLVQTPDTAGRAETGNTQQDHSHHWRFRWPSTQAWFDFFLVLFTGGLFMTSYLQWHAVNDTLTQTKRLVDVAHIQANTAAESVKAAQEANELTKEAQRRANDIVADADRPWIGVHHIELGDYTTERKINTKLQILNSGKTPALNVTTKINWKVISGLPEAPSDEETSRAYEPQGPLFPNQGMDLLPVFNDLLSSEGKYSANPLPLQKKQHPPEKSGIT